MVREYVDCVGRYLIFLSLWASRPRNIAPAVISLLHTNGDAEY